MKVSSVVTGAVSALAIGIGALGLGACSPQDGVGSTSSQLGGAAGETGDGAVGADGDTVALVAAAVDLPQADDEVAGVPAGGGGGEVPRKGLRARLLRALHATWVTSSANGPVTHQAIRGEVTAVSSTSITVRAKDGVAMTFSVGDDTKVRARTKPVVDGSGKAVKGTGSDSTIGAVPVGGKALVVGVGATDPRARVIVYLTGSAAS